MSTDTPRLRLGIVGVVAVSLFVALFARLWFLQVLTAGEHELAAQRNQRRTIPLPATRGASSIETARCWSPTGRRTWSPSIAPDSGRWNRGRRRR